MQFKTWQEFFEMNRVFEGSLNTLSYEEERYQHFKARLMDEVVAGWPSDNKPISQSNFPLKNKDE